MSESTQRKSFAPHLGTILFVAILFAGLALDALSFFRLADLRKRQALLNLTLENEKRITDELASLYTQFKSYESEYQLMEHGLKELYATRCSRLNEFTPVFDDVIVACRPKRSRRSHAYDAMIHVPERGSHRLKVEAVKTLHSAARTYSQQNEEITWAGSFPLEPGSNQSIEIYSSRLSSRKIWIKVSDQKSKLIEFPFSQISTTGTLDLSHERTIMSPNQYSAIPKSDQEKFWFGSVLFFPASNGSQGIREAFWVRLAIESDGPLTSLPDDLMVVGKLLGDYENGIKPNFVFSSDSLYEFHQ